MHPKYLTSFNIKSVRCLIFPDMGLKPANLPLRGPNPNYVKSSQSIRPLLYVLLFQFSTFSVLALHLFNNPNVQLSALISFNIVLYIQGPSLSSISIFLHSFLYSPYFLFTIPCVPHHFIVRFHHQEKRGVSMFKTQTSMLLFDVCLPLV